MRIRTVGHGDFITAATTTITTTIITTTTTNVTATNVTASYYIPSTATVVVAMTAINGLHHCYRLWCDDCGSLSLHLLHTTSSTSAISHGWTSSITEMTKNILIDRLMMMILMLLMPLRK